MLGDLVFIFEGMQLVAWLTWIDVGMFSTTFVLITLFKMFYFISKFLSSKINFSYYGLFYFLRGLACGLWWFGFVKINCFWLKMRGFTKSIDLFFFF
jgi:hypothetical protein